MPQEVELKLTVDPDALPAAQRHPALRALKGGRARTTQLASIYYDTATAELHAAGVALRVRRDGRRWMQTVKGEGSVSAGLHTREEYEWPIASAHVDDRKLLETPWRAV